jgi:hypothetical protein
MDDHDNSSLEMLGTQLTSSNVLKLKKSDSTEIFHSSWPRRSSSSDIVVLALPSSPTVQKSNQQQLL